MRFDNPIYDHGFEFPDIADFPDILNESRFQGDGKEEIEIMTKGIEKKNLDIFKKGYENFTKVNDEKLFKKIDHMFSFYSTFEKRRKDLNIKSNKIFEDLFENGISFLRVDTKKIYELLEKDIDKLLGKSDWVPPIGVFDRSVELSPNIIKILNNGFYKMGILHAVTKYNGTRPLQIARGVLHIAKPSDNNWKQFLQDCKTVSKTTSYHIDPKEDVMKAMIYLNDISEKNGAFSYVKKSHRWVYDDLQNIFGRAISTGSYCHNKESRASVLQFPKKLRVSHNFGRLLLDNTHQQNMILDRETVCTSSNHGNLIVFDTAGMHRGGVCQSDYRIALQILMK